MSVSALRSLATCNLELVQLSPYFFLVIRYAQGSAVNYQLCIITKYSSALYNRDGRGFQASWNYI